MAELSMQMQRDSTDEVYLSDSNIDLMNNPHVLYSPSDFVIHDDGLIDLTAISHSLSDGFDKSNVAECACVNNDAVHDENVMPTLNKFDVNDNVHVDTDCASNVNNDDVYELSLSPKSRRKHKDKLYRQNVRKTNKKDRVEKHKHSKQ